MTPKEAAEAFRRMAEAIERNADAKFGGAAVLAPPAGNPTEMLFIDNRENAMQFFSNIEAIAKVSMTELLEEEQRQKAFGRR